MKTCKTCGTEKPIEEFSITSKARGYRYPHCKPCCAERARQRRAADPDGYNAHQRAYYATRKDDPQVKRMYRQASRKHVARMKADLIERLGGQCMTCGETDHAVLEIDHRVPEDPRRARRSDGRVDPVKERRRLRALPDEDLIQQVQALCANCHRRKTNQEHSLRRRMLR